MIKFIKKIYCFYKGQGFHKWKRVGGYYICERCSTKWYPPKSNCEKNVKEKV